MKTCSIPHITAAVLLAALIPAQAGNVRLHQLDLTAMTSGWGKPQRNLFITHKPFSNQQVPGVESQSYADGHSGRLWLEYTQTVVWHVGWVPVADPWSTPQMHLGTIPHHSCQLNGKT
jgi:hypothetical protein